MPEPQFSYETMVEPPPPEPVAEGGTAFYLQPKPQGITFPQEEAAAKEAAQQTISEESLKSWVRHMRDFYRNEKQMTGSDRRHLQELTSSLRTKAGVLSPGKRIAVSQQLQFVAKQTDPETVRKGERPQSEWGLETKKHEMLESNVPAEAEVGSLMEKIDKLSDRIKGKMAYAKSLADIAQRIRSTAHASGFTVRPQFLRLEELPRKVSPYPRELSPSLEMLGVPKPAWPEYEPYVVDIKYPPTGEELKLGEIIDAMRYLEKVKSKPMSATQIAEFRRLSIELDTAWKNHPLLYGIADKVVRYGTRLNFFIRPRGVVRHKLMEAPNLHLGVGR